MGLDYAVMIWHNKVRGLFPYALYQGQTLIDGKPKYGAEYVTTIQGELKTLYIYLDNEEQKEKLDAVLISG